MSNSTPTTTEEARLRMLAIATQNMSDKDKQRLREERKERWEELTASLQAAGPGFSWNLGWTGDRDGATTPALTCRDGAFALRPLNPQADSDPTFLVGLYLTGYLVGTPKDPIHVLSLLGDAQTNARGVLTTIKQHVDVLALEVRKMQRLFETSRDRDMQPVLARMEDAMKVRYPSKSAANATTNTAQRRGHTVDPFNGYRSELDLTAQKEAEETAGSEEAKDQSENARWGGYTACDP